MDIHNISSSLHKLNAFNENSGINNNNNNEHVADTKVMEQSLCDRLLGVVKAYEKEKKGKHEKRENKNKENKKATRKIHHNKNKNNKNKNNKNKKTRKNNNNRN